jgi:uncharacterized membrane protein
MSTIAIIIFVAIGLVIMMHLNDQTRDQLSLTEEKHYAPFNRNSSLAGYIVAIGVILGITVLAVRACEGSF